MGVHGHLGVCVLTYQGRSFHTDGAITKSSPFRATSYDTDMLSHHNKPPAFASTGEVYQNEKRKTTKMVNR
jgi:hypothetical protein